MQNNNSLTTDILDSIGEGLFTVDKNFKINYFNRTAEKITRLSRREVIGKFCKHIFKSNRCFMQCPIAHVLEIGKNIYNLESKICDKDGNTIPINMNVAILKNSENEPVGGVISFRDISDIAILRDKYLKKINSMAQSVTVNPCRKYLN